MDDGNDPLPTFHIYKFPMKNMTLTNSGIIGASLSELHTSKRICMVNHA